MFGFVVMELGTQWSVVGGIVGQKMSDMAGCGENRADKGIPTQSESDDFTAEGIFLSGKGESDKCGTIKASICGIDCKDTPNPNKECDFAQSKKCVLTSGNGIFTRPTKEEKRYMEHVDHSQRFNL
jgi:hypothetical protein